MYFDPGIGSIVVQVLIGFLVAIPVLVGVYRRKLVGLLRRIRGGKGSE